MTSTIQVDPRLFHYEEGNQGDWKVIFKACTLIRLAHSKKQENQVFAIVSAFMRQDSNQQAMKIRRTYLKLVGNASAATL